MLSLLIGAFLAHSHQVVYDDADAAPIWSVDQALLQKAWMKGWEEGKKKKGNLDNLLDFLRTDMGRVRSPTGERWRASCVIPFPPFAKMELAGFQSGRRFETYESEGKAVVEDVATHRNSADRTIAFAIQLNAWPGLSDYNGDINRRANQKDVRASDFVLMIDDRKIKLKDTLEGESSTLNGSVSVPITDTSTSSVSSGGRTYSSTVTYTTNQTHGYDAYSAIYGLVFPYFAPDGKPYITKNTKSIFLRVVMPNGVRDVSLDLAKLKTNL